MGLRGLLERLGQRLRLRKRGAVVATAARPIPRTQLWELWEGVGDEALAELLEEAREDAEDAVENMTIAYRQPN